MAASITRPINDTILCTFLHGQPPERLKERVSTWGLPGLDGYGAQRMGLGNAPFAFVAVLYGTEAAIDTWIIRIASIQAQIVSVRDDWNKPHFKLLVTRVEEPQKTPAISHLGTVRGEVQISGVTHQA